MGATNSPNNDGISPLLSAAIANNEGVVEFYLSTFVTQKIAFVIILTMLYETFAKSIKKLLSLELKLTIYIDLSLKDYSNFFGCFQCLMITLAISISCLVYTGIIRMCPTRIK